MSSRLTMILAGLFLLAALLAGYWGLRLSRPLESLPAPAMPPAEAAVPAAPVPVAPPEPPRSPIVILRRAIAANTP